MNNTLPPITMEQLSAQKHKCLAELMSPSTTIWNSHTVVKASKKVDRPDCTLSSPWSDPFLFIEPFLISASGSLLLLLAAAAAPKNEAVDMFHIFLIQ